MFTLEEKIFPAMLEVEKNLEILLSSLSFYKWEYWRPKGKPTSHKQMPTYFAKSRIHFIHSLKN